MSLNSLIKTMHFAVVTIFMIVVIISCDNPNNIDPPPADIGFVPNEIIEAIPFEDLLELTQEKTFKYFWDFAEPISGLAREDSNRQNIITIGGSGFGIAALPVAVEREWVSRDDAVNRMETILSFLEGAQTYHGAFSHWYDNAGNTIPFSTLDDGGDIVETALLIQGLLIARKYFSQNNTKETEIRNRITKIWEGVEWTWYTQGQNKITWHWSPVNNFDINLDVKGWNESLIVYVLAASSPTYPINNDVYKDGWTSNGNIINTGTFYDIYLPLGENFGGPLFFSHYSFIGINPTNLSDEYTNYFDQNRAHSLINYKHCVENPFGYDGYNDVSWGITASANYNGYSAHSPTNDLGVIAPTAALSSFPYTPLESKKALEHFYYNLNDNLWGEYGFYDAFSVHYNWYSDKYIAIDQGPILLMIENYRTQLLWNLFMQDHDIINGLTELGFNF
ncbi:MAG: beta-glucosidase [Flavobacteriaceae bacterium]|nr:beta-glucosidase [Flavobacteriaceae bacterium]